MNIQVLVSSVNKTKKDIKNMNITTDAIIINQVEDGHVCEELSGFDQKEIMYYEFSERGVGKSRNSALMRSTADIIVMADDDEVFVDGYENIIKQAFLTYPDADMLVFNVCVHEDGQTYPTTTRSGRVRLHNSLKYGTVTFAFKRQPIFKNNIFFSLLFGGGAKYGSGEDSLFLWSVLKNKLKVYSVPETISNVYNDESSWFNGYNKKYFFDKGALFKALGGRISPILILQYWVRKRNLINSEVTKIEMLIQMIRGAKDFKNL